MIDLFKKLFSKGDDDLGTRLPLNEKAEFQLVIEDKVVGVLKCEKGEWIFQYSQDFKENRKDYHLLIGFPDQHKEYRSNSLWPFFRIRIPGLKQPAVKEILEKEKIDKENELALLKRFGARTISNPYILLPSL